MRGKTAVPAVSANGRPACWWNVMASAHTSYPSNDRRGRLSALTAETAGFRSSLMPPGMGWDVPPLRFPVPLRIQIEAKRGGAEDTEIDAE